MNAVSVDIAAILASDSHTGLVLGTNMFVNREPSKPNNCVTIFDTQGRPPYLGVDGTTGYEYPSNSSAVLPTSGSAIL